MIQTHQQHNAGGIVRLIAEIPVGMDSIALYEGLGHVSGVLQLLVAVIVSLGVSTRPGLCAQV